MTLNRKQFGLGLAATLSAVTAASKSSAADSEVVTTPSGENQTHYFFKNSSFEFVFISALGRAYHQAGDVGKLLYLSKQIVDGDSESAFQAFKGAGDEAAAIAADAASRGHRESARQAYLWAQNYYDTATYFVDGTPDPSRFLPTWELLYDAWLKSLPLYDPPGEPVLIPYENTQLHGFHFRNGRVTGKRPLLIMANGSDGSTLDMWTYGGAGALARGYDMLTFDGPGQQYALWKQGLYFRPDWEKVITPVVDVALTLPDIDPKRIALLGISQGGYWVPRSVAFEKRIAAAVADPGVVDVSASWTAALPKPLVELIEAGKKEEFDAIVDKSMPPDAKRGLLFRMRPYGMSSYYDVFKATMAYNLTDIAPQITCPMLVTAPENEAFWPGQADRLYELLTSPKTLARFTAAEGADLHCEPNGFGIRDLRIFDWLDETLAGL